MGRARSKRVFGTFFILMIIYLLTSRSDTRSDSSLKSKLAAKFDFQDQGHIEKHIWQSWKTKEKLGKEFQENSLLWAGSEGYDYHLLDDDDARSFVEYHYAEFPEIIDAYRILPRKVLRADFFRYLVILAQGGIYADIDTQLKVPIDLWLKDEKIIELAQSHDLSLSSISAVIGVEEECDCWGWRGIFTRRLQFCQWTFVAKKGHPIFVDLVSKITHLTLNNYNSSSGLITFPKGYKGMANYALVYNMSEGSDSWYNGILEWTGPGPFTDSVFQYLNSYYSSVFSHMPEGTRDSVSCASSKQCVIDPNKPLDLTSKLQHPPPLADNLLGRKLPHQPIGWENFTLIEEPILIGSIVILPKSYFNQKYANSEAKNYIEHGFKGTWKWDLKP